MMAADQQMAEPAVSSGNALYDECIQQDSELLELAHKLWMHSQAVNLSIASGYHDAGLSQRDFVRPLLKGAAGHMLIAIDGSLPMTRNHRG
jgi:hypothetical protein